MFSRFQKVLKTLEMILAWFYIGTRFGIIGEPLKRLERSRLEVISGFGAVGALPLPRGTVRFLYEWLIARGSAHTQPSVCAFFHSFLPPFSQSINHSVTTHFLRGFFCIRHGTGDSETDLSAKDSNISAVESIT